MLYSRLRSVIIKAQGVEKMKHQDFILMVEDNEDDFEVISRGLKSVGLEAPISWYRRTKDVLEYFDDLAFNKKLHLPLPRIIILDLNMPGMDGRSILSIIKSNSKLKSIPVVILSTSIDRRDVDFCYSEGANTYMQKPLRFQKLQDICKSLKDYWFNTAILESDLPNNTA